LIVCSALDKACRLFIRNPLDVRVRSQKLPSSIRQYQAAAAEQQCATLLAVQQLKDSMILRAENRWVDAKTSARAIPIVIGCFNAAIRCGASPKPFDIPEKHMNPEGRQLLAGMIARFVETTRNQQTPRSELPLIVRGSSIEKSIADSGEWYRSHLAAITTG
jgi:hypothetical protein